MALHVFVCVLLIVAVLMQSSKSGDISSTLGGGTGSNEMFGPSAPANVMNKITTVLATCFLLLSLTLAIMSKGSGSDSLLQNINSQQAPISGQE
jgi:preprotein translocase subunit SecG